jgi:hypothetical protein
MANIKRVNALGITKPGTAISDVPDAPTIGTATGGSAAATVTYTAAATGGTATTFTATSNPGSLTGTGASPITISGLTSGTSYTFTVTASNSTGTSPASSASNSVTPESLGDMDPIAMVEVGSGGSSSITFSSIPATYTHLQIRGIVRDTTAGTGYQNASIEVNGATTGYTLHYIAGTGTSVVTDSAASGSQSYLYPVVNGGALSNSFCSVVIDILDYANTNKYKTFRCLSGFDLNGTSGTVRFASGSWQNTNAISSIRLFTYGDSGNLAQYSQFALYGIKDA